MTPAESVSLRPVTRKKVHAVSELELADGRRHLVAPSAFVVAEAITSPARCCERIHRGERPSECSS